MMVRGMLWCFISLACVACDVEVTDPVASGAESSGEESGPDDEPVAPDSLSTPQRGVDASSADRLWDCRWRRAETETARSLRVACEDWEAPISGGCRDEAGAITDQYAYENNRATNAPENGESWHETVGRRGWRCQRAVSDGRMRGIALCCGRENTGGIIPVPPQGLGLNSCAMYSADPSDPDPQAVECPTGKKPIAGGCAMGASAPGGGHPYELNSFTNLPEDGETWHSTDGRTGWRCEGSSGGTAYVTCCAQEEQ